MRLNFFYNAIYFCWVFLLTIRRLLALNEWVMEDEVVEKRRRKELNDGELKKSFKSSSLFSCFILQCFHFSSISFYSLIDSRETWSTSIAITEVNGEVINNKKSLLYNTARIVDERERNNKWMSVYTTHLVLVIFTIQSNKR